ncbi:MAG TPA: CocE/NonD family hydrolase, partial [Vicinamibacterales bacterium]|nr:CocE/NonD family hydrolase [Vicinamibacterales bacterium]
LILVGARRSVIPIVLLAAAGILSAPAGQVPRVAAAHAAQGARPAAAQPRPLPTRRTFTGMTSSSRYVTMRDGVRLAVDVHLPKGLAPGERTATILHMSRYYRSVDIRGIWRLFTGSGIYPITESDLREAFVKAGYSWVDVDVRGAGASFGHRDYPLSPEEVRDGADLIDWIVAQPWSAGVVGATGSSYDGSLATVLLSNRHPALRAVAPRFSGWDAYADVWFPGGLLARSLLDDWAKLVSALDGGRIGDVFGWTGTMMARGVRPVDPALLPKAIAEHARNVDLRRLIGSLVYRDDPDYRGRPVTIDDFSPHSFAPAIAGTPVYVYGGWFDGALPRGQILQFLASRHPGSRLRLGPWFHAGQFNASPYAGGRNNDFDHAAELMRFFDHHLRGADNGFARELPVHYYTMGEERWKTSRSWPPPGAVTQAYYFGPSQRLERDAPAAPTAPAPIRAAAPSSQRPERGVPAASDEAYDRYVVDETVTSGPGSRWGLIVGTGARRGYGDRRDRAKRLLTYTSPPLREDVEVTGHPVVHLFMSANATDGAVFAYLEDVRPNGEVRYVTEGQLRLLHRRLRPQASPPSAPIPFRTYTRADGRPVTPGEVMEVVFDLLPTSFVFRTGHAIRLAIAGVDAGTFDAPVLASPLAYEVHRDRLHRSRIELPTYAR